MCISKTHHFLSSVVVKTSVESFKIFYFGVSWVLLPDNRSVLPSQVHIPQVAPFDQEEQINTRWTFGH